jgi:hypothetical protein
MFGGEVDLCVCVQWVDTENKWLLILDSRALKIKASSLETWSSGEGLGLHK